MQYIEAKKALLGRKWTQIERQERYVDIESKNDRRR
jgi:disulfide oxidoreductase YuzD